MSGNRVKDKDGMEAFLAVSKADVAGRLFAIRESTMDRWVVRASYMHRFLVLVVDSPLGRHGLIPAAQMPSPNEMKLSCGSYASQRTGQYLVDVPMCDFIRRRDIERV